jgi:hypothetical protein
MTRKQIRSAMKLTKETIRILGSVELDQIVGAGKPPERTATCTCPPA